MREKVCVHTSRDIRAISSQLVSVWLEIFRKEKSNGGSKFARLASAVDSSRRKLQKDSNSGKPPLRAHYGVLENKGCAQLPASSGDNVSPSTNRRMNGKPIKQETTTVSKSEGTSSKSGGTMDKLNHNVEESNYEMSEEERAAIEAAERARAAAEAAAEVCFFSSMLLGACWCR